MVDPTPTSDQPNTATSFFDKAKAVFQTVVAPFNWAAEKVAAYPKTSLIVFLVVYLSTVWKLI